MVKQAEKKVKKSAEKSFWASLNISEKRSQELMNKSFDLVQKNSYYSDLVKAIESDATLTSMEKVAMAMKTGRAIGRMDAAPSGMGILAGILSRR